VIDTLDRGIITDTPDEFIANIFLGNLAYIDDHSLISIAVPSCVGFDQEHHPGHISTHSSSSRQPNIYRPAVTTRFISPSRVYQLHPDYLHNRQSGGSNSKKKPGIKNRTNKNSLRHDFEMIGISEFASRMSVCTNTVRNWIAEEKLTKGIHYMHSGRIFRFPWSQQHIENLMRALTSERPPTRPPMKSQRSNRGRLKLRA
jgi:hypothetical protein